MIIKWYGKLGRFGKLGARQGLANSLIKCTENTSPVGKHETSVTFNDNHCSIPVLENNTTPTVTITVKSLNITALD